ncbi:MAG: AraC family transcriptional regulator [Eubacteriales bacterium]|nr:AraC family transcriptional regulator [Eubacteriales bacterium]MDD3882069.1 AraC family transcriptional regulator [Eubacteriales bacterium]MDD4512516.1 AraC family transcriptional regulator [Eubacteriales bacterium]
MNYQYELGRDGMTAPVCFIERNDECLPHFHAAVELVYVLSGELESVIDGRVITARENEIIIVSGFAVHSYHTQASSECMVAIIPMSIVPTFQKTSADKRFNVEKCTDDEEFSLKSMFEFLMEQSAASREAKKGACYYLLGRLMDKVGMVSVDRNAPAELIRQTLRYLEEHYAEDITVSSLSKRFGYSESRFSHIFNSYLHCGLRQYIGNLRCRHALLLMRETDDTYLEISEKVGFECIRSFYRAFARSYGKTPSEYLKEC